MSKDITLEFQGLEDFLSKCEQIGKGELKTEIAKWMEALGFEFLDIIQDEIIRLQVVDTRLLLNSFTKGSNEGFWQVRKDGLELEIGTNVSYAKFVNDGHWLNPTGVSKRFVPGRWSNGKFIYDPNASGGMMLKQKFIEGKHFWESATYIFERIFAKSLERKLEQWLNNLFN